MPLKLVGKSDYSNFPLHVTGYIMETYSTTTTTGAWWTIGTRFALLSFHSHKVCKGEAHAKYCNIMVWSFHRVSFIHTSQNATPVARHYMYVATINNNHLLYRIELYAKRGNTAVKNFSPGESNEARKGKSTIGARC